MTPNEEKLASHIDKCKQCTRACRGRFSGATVEEIHKQRCDFGRTLAIKTFKEFEDR